jgi:hypothetical protein
LPSTTTIRAFGFPLLLREYPALDPGIYGCGLRRRKA